MTKSLEIMQLVIVLVSIERKPNLKLVTLQISYTMSFPKMKSLLNKVIFSAVIGSLFPSK